jgi:hypothetical protein
MAVEFLVMACVLSAVRLHGPSARHVFGIAGFSSHVAIAGFSGLIAIALRVSALITSSQRGLVI